jgi:hypothetical protein
MNKAVLPKVFALEIDGVPPLTFEAVNIREARQLCREQWLKEDLSEARSGGSPLGDGNAKLSARLAKPDERALFADVARAGSELDLDA